MIIFKINLKKDKSSNFSKLNILSSNKNKKKKLKIAFIEAYKSLEKLLKMLSVTKVYQKSKINPKNTKLIHITPWSH